jgi:hypothetical protein
MISRPLLDLCIFLRPTSPQETRQSS